MPLERITVLCFAASYALALIFELARVLWPRGQQRLIAIALGIAGLFAQSIYLLVQRPALASQFGSLLFLAWILAVFYLYGSLHHRHMAWGIFVLPVVLGLVLLATVFDHVSLGPWHTERFWGMFHGGLLLFAAVGVCVGFVASAMYLVHARQLRVKTLPDDGLRLLSLEKLEQMNRRAIMWAFPFLTAGVVVGFVLMVHDTGRLEGWTDPKILSSLLLWVVFAILLYLRYGRRVYGRQAALLTIAAFGLLLLTLLTPAHSFLAGGPP